MYHKFLAVGWRVSVDAFEPCLYFPWYQCVLLSFLDTLLLSAFWTCLGALWDVLVAVLLVARDWLLLIVGCCRLVRAAADAVIAWLVAAYDVAVGRS